MGANKHGIGSQQAAAGGRQSGGVRRALRPLVTFLALGSLMLLMLSCSASHRLAEPVTVQPTPASITSSYPSAQGWMR